MSPDLFLGGLAVLVMAAIIIVLMTRGGRIVPSDGKDAEPRVERRAPQRDKKD